MNNLTINLIWWVLCMIVFVLGYFIGGKFMRNQMLYDSSSKTFDVREMHRKRKLYNFTDNELRALFTVLCNAAYMNSDIDNLILDIHNEWNNRNTDSYLTDIILEYILEHSILVKSYLEEGKIEEYQKIVHEYIRAYSEMRFLKLSNRNIDIDTFTDKYKLIFQKKDIDYIVETFNNKSAEFFETCLEVNKGLLRYIDKLILITNNEKEK